MLIIGAKGFAKEILEILNQKNETENLCFYDDVNSETCLKLYDKFEVINNLEKAKSYFETVSPNFTLGIGNPDLRAILYQKFKNIGGELTSTISNHSDIGSFGVEIGKGCNILGGVKISNDVTIGLGTMIYYNSIVTHDVKIGKFVEISPNVTVLGRAQISDSARLGAGSIIFPDIKIGKNAIVAAGSVVRKNVPENTMVAGVPATIKKTF